MSIDGNLCVINCVYNEAGSITSVTQCDTVEIYTYYPDSVIYVRSISTEIAYKYIYSIGASGLATSYRRIARDGSITDYSLSYDADQNRTRLVDTIHPNTFINYSIKEGNAVYDSSASSVIGSANYTIRRGFYANTANTISNENFGKKFLGRSSENFKKSEIYNTPDGEYTVKYTYELDYQNGVSRRIMKVNDSIIESRYYSYY